jgi:hypothetical protein
MKTQMECWQALIDGKELMRTDGNLRYKMIDGKVVFTRSIWDNMEQSVENFDDPPFYSIIEQPDTSKYLYRWVIKSKEGHWYSPDAFMTEENVSKGYKGQSYQKRSGPYIEKDGKLVEVKDV